MKQPFMILPSTDKESEEIHQRLREYNRQFAGVRKDYSYHIVDQGKMVAGIVARSTFDTLEVEFLFVDEQYRGKGLGSYLLVHVESLAARDGLRRVLLSTYSYQAPEFYRARGYTQLCAITPCFGEHSEFFFEKKLSSGSED